MKAVAELRRSEQRRPIHDEEHGGGGPSYRGATGRRGAATLSRRRREETWRPVIANEATSLPSAATHPLSRCRQSYSPAPCSSPLLACSLR